MSSGPSRATLSIVIAAAYPLAERVVCAFTTRDRPDDGRPCSDWVIGRIAVRRSIRGASSSGASDASSTPPALGGSFGVTSPSRLHQTCADPSPSGDRLLTPAGSTHASPNRPGSVRVPSLGDDTRLGKLDGSVPAAGLRRSAYHATADQGGGVKSGGL